MQSPAKLNEKLALQIAVAIGAMLPITAGLMGVIQGPAAFDPGATAGLSLDSHTRYLSGLLLAIGLAFLSTIPAIETEGVRVRLLTAIVVLGGLGRLYGIAATGSPPPAPMLGGLAMELIITPALALWRERVQRQLT